MAEAPITPDPEQQRADNEASRRQSGLDPNPDADEKHPSRDGDGDSTRDAGDRDQSSTDSTSSGSATPGASS